MTACTLASDSQERVEGHDSMAAISLAAPMRYAVPADGADVIARRANRTPFLAHVGEVHRIDRIGEAGGGHLA
jgi:hypothetical protein